MCFHDILTEYFHVSRSPCRGPVTRRPLKHEARGVGFITRNDLLLPYEPVTGSKCLGLVPSLYMSGALFSCTNRPKRE